MAVTGAKFFDTVRWCTPSRKATYAISGWNVLCKAWNHPMKHAIWRRIISMLTLALTLGAQGISPAGAALACEDYFQTQPQRVEAEVEALRPRVQGKVDIEEVTRRLQLRQEELKIGELPESHSQHELFLRFFAGMPLPLELPLNTQKLMTLKLRTGGYRRGIAPIWSSFATLSAVLDLSGVFGPRSPIGRIGAIGDKPINPWFWWQRAVMAGVWTTAPRDLFEIGGPLNPRTGILSKIGPLADDWLQGNFNIFGTNSPAGPLSLLGPLGPMGAVMSLGNMMLDASGFYFDKNTHKVISSIFIPHGKDLRKFDVFEKLSKKYSDELSASWLLDTSYAVDNQLKSFENERVFRSTAPNSEIVSVVVVPDFGTTSTGVWWLPKRLNFDLVVENERGEEIVSSTLREKSNLVQFQVRKGQKFAVKVRRQGYSAFNAPQNFRLVVTGATSYFGKQLWENILGPEFVALWKSDSMESELALNYIWVETANNAFALYKEAVRGGNTGVVGHPWHFWRESMTDAVKTYSKLKSRAKDSAELDRVLLSELELSIKKYEKLVTEDPLNGDEMLKMWQQTMTNTQSQAENIFNLTAEMAAKLPMQWLDWMNQNMNTYQDMMAPQGQ